jgi:hypothetical protein
VQVMFTVSRDVSNSTTDTGRQQFKYLRVQCHQIWGMASVSEVIEIITLYFSVNCSLHFEVLYFCSSYFVHS